MSTSAGQKPGQGKVKKIVIFVICVLLSIISLLPFWLTFVNASRTSSEIQSGLTLIPGGELIKNVKSVLARPDLDIMLGFKNSLILSTAVTACSLLFATATAYGLTVYQFRLRDAAFTFIMAIMMIPQQVSIIGFYKLCSNLGILNSFAAIILPAIAAPPIAFYMRQYMKGALSVSLVEAARIDGCNEFRTFFTISLPIMTPALATQGIFAFITAWNNFFTPSIVLTEKSKYTLPIQIAQMKSDTFRTDYGQVYAGVFLAMLPLIIVYIILSKFIVEGVSAGGVKE
ncbi:MAG: carbohydrate ABC transporter permease [Ruminococcus sp.]|nr:carbohydrate ABC transporter permease [Ruminococcus sp.]